MDTLIRDIIVIVICIGVCVRWWFNAVDHAYRKYIILMGICFVTTVVLNMLAKSFDISTLVGISGFTLIGAIGFYIKALLAQRRAKKKLYIEALLA